MPNAATAAYCMYRRFDEAIGAGSPQRYQPFNEGSVYKQGANMNSIYKVRRFQTEDAEEVSALIARTLRMVNIKDYSPKYIEAVVSSFPPEELIKRAEQGHMYVVCDNSRIVGCGAIAGYWGSITESILLTVFVLPEYQGNGIGRLIIQTLEQDEFFLRAKRIEVPASITAVNFYKKMGYEYKNGIPEIDEEQVYRLEKFR